MKRAALSSILAAGLVALAAPGAAMAQAQAYPNKAIRIVVPFTAGSATDIMARTIGEKLTATWGQPVIVDNKPGAGGTIGANQVAKGDADGYTLLVVSTGHVVNPVLYSSIPYDTLADFSGVSVLANLPSVLVVSANSPFKNVQELVASARAKPGQLNFATAGVGSATHVNTAKFLVASGSSATHIPFKGTPETITETISGRVDFMFTPVLASLPSIRDGRMRPLAVSTGKRNNSLANVPTVAESGLPGFEFNFWVGLLAPSKTPRDIVNKLNAEVARIMQLPEVRERMANLGAEAMPMSPEQFDAYIKDEFNTLGAVMRAAGTKVQ